MKVFILTVAGSIFLGLGAPSFANQNLDAEELAV